MDGPHRKSPERVEYPSPYISHEEPLPPILTLAEVAAYFDRKPNTIYGWKARGLLDNACRRHGKHLFFWRDKVTKLKHEFKEHKDGFQ
tara:strand:- start:61600 stop:61863 length:264 start_codon:yes stop_codon:yes gene_type:complete